MKKSILTAYLVIGISLLTIAQDKGYTGGFQFKAMIGSNYFNGGDNITDLDSVSITHSAKFGYTFGMTFRKQFTKSLAVESGLRLVQRNYAVQVDSTSLNSNYQSNIDYRLIGYEIPLKGIVRLRASKNSYFLVGLGVELDLYPSDVFASSYDWQVETLRKSWAQGSFLANAGWEIHPPGNGTFYAGFSFNRPFTAPFIAKVGEYNTNVADVNVELNGVYLSLDLRYYFETKKNKKVEK